MGDKVRRARFGDDWAVVERPYCFRLISWEQVRSTVLGGWCGRASERRRAVRGAVGWRRQTGPLGRVWLN